MNDTEFKQLIESSWRAKSNAADEARLHEHFALHPEARAAWAEETELTSLLSKVSAPAVSTNFTSLVMQRIDREEQKHRSNPFEFLNRHFFRFAIGRSVAFAVILLGVGVVTYQQYLVREREHVADSVARLSTAADIPSLDNSAKIWRDFESINRMSKTSGEADLELLAALE